MTRNNGKPTLSVARDERSGDVSEDTMGSLVGNGATLTRTQTQYTTAIQVQIPRNRKGIQIAVLDEAELAGDDFFYSWTTNNKDGTRGLIEGLSIEGAMILFRNWGNCALPTEIAQESPSHWIFSTTFVDLETGANIQRLFRQRKNQTAGGKMDADRMMDIAFQIGQSKCQRNAVDKAMPNWLKEAALEKAKAASEKKFENIAEANTKALGAYARLGVSQQQLEEKLGFKLEHWTARDHVSLSGLWRALRDRQTTIDQEFPKEAPPAEQEPAAEEPKPQPSPYGDVVETKPAAAAPAPTESRKSEPPPPPPAAAAPTGPVVPDLQPPPAQNAAPVNSAGMSAEDVRAAQELDREPAKEKPPEPAPKGTKRPREAGED